MSDEGVEAATRAVRRYLPELVGPAAEVVDAEITAVQATVAGDTARAERLSQLLRSREGTRAFLEAVLSDAPRYRPPQVQPFTVKGFGYSGLPGRIGSIGAPMFHCPVGNDYDWWEQMPDDIPPLCPTHGCALERA